MIGRLNNYQLVNTEDVNVYHKSCVAINDINSSLVRNMFLYGFSECNMFI